MLATPVADYENAEPAERVLDELVLVLLEHTRLGALLHQHPDLLLGHRNEGRFNLDRGLFVSRLCSGLDFPQVRLAARKQ